jgi:hypothetical protein
MLIARIIPQKTDRYQVLAEYIKKWDGFMKFKPAEWFSIWILLIAGQSTFYNQMNRFYFWDFSHWIRGIILMLLITIIYSYLRKNFPKFRINELNIRSLGGQTLLSIVLLTLGYGSISIMGLKLLIPYLLAYLSIMLIFTIRFAESKEGTATKVIIESQSQKRFTAVLSSILMFTALLIGFIFDDPLISTAGIVTLPFLLLVIIGKHKRHLQRARFYPIFIFCVFVCAREGWFLVPNLALFFLLRYYNYFRSGTVYPTFGVEFD